MIAASNKHHTSVDMKDLIAVLESLKIGSAISLDDDYLPTFSSNELESMKIDDFLSLCRMSFSRDEITEIEDSGVISVFDFFQSDIISSDIKAKAELLLKSLKEQQTSRSLRFLEDGFKDSSIAFTKIPGYDSFPFKSLEGTICFIDKEIDGKDILPTIIPRICNGCEPDKTTIVVVFTSDNDLESLNTSWEKRYNYLVNNLGVEAKTAEWLSYSFYIVLKKEITSHLDINEETAWQYLSNILMASMSGYCTSCIIQKMHENSEKSFKRLLEVTKDANPKTFQNIQYNMVKEGEPNVYHAFRSILNYMQELEYTDGFEQYSRYVLAMKRIARMSPEKSVEEISAQSLKDILHHFDWTQFQFIHKDVNKTFADITHGDVFKLICSSISPCIGVLITQPCDCIIRGDKDQTNRKALRFTLVLFKEEVFFQKDIEQPKDSAGKKEKDSWCKNIRKLRDKGIILSSENDDTPAAYIDVSSPKAAIQVLPFILDLASLNEDGKAVLLDTKDLEQTVKQKKTNNWREYYKWLENEVKQHSEQIHLLCETLGEKADEVVYSLYNIPFSQKDNQFCIERIGHLEDNIVELISYNYITHTYRAGKNSLLSLNSDLENDEGDA